MEQEDKRTFGFELKIDPKEKLTIQPSTIAFVIFAATIPLYSPNMGIFGGFANGDALIGYFVFPMLFGALITAAAVVFYAAKRSDWRSFSLRTLGFATVLYCGGALTFFVVIQASFSNLELFRAVVIGAGMAVGFGMVPLCVAWGTHFALSLRNALLWGSITCVAASLLAWVLTITPSPVLDVIYPILLLVGAGLPWFKMKRGTLSYPQRDEAHVNDLQKSENFESGCQGEVREGSLEEADIPGLLASLRRILSIIWLPFIGLLFYAFLTSVHKFYVFGDFDSEFFGALLAVLFVIPLCFVKSNKPLLPFVYKVIVPIFVAILIILGSFPVETFPQYLGAVGIYVFSVFLALFAMASLLAVAHAGEFSPPLLYGFVLVCGIAVTLVGLFLAQVVAAVDNFGPVMWVITCFFFAIILLYLGIGSWRSFSSPEEREGEKASSLQENLHHRCEAISVRFSLSSRESEILGYLSRGYSPTYIARTLVISVSTARSHVRNIYRKIGVGSREELLQLIDSQE